MPSEDVFDQVVAEVEKEIGGDPTERLEKAEEASEEQKVETPEEPVKTETEEETPPPARPRGPDGKFLKKEGEEKVEEEEEEPLGLNAEQLAAIEKDPSLRAVYKSMQRGFTQKTQSIAEKRKALAEKEKFYDWVQTDPENALRAMVQAKGWKLAEEVKEEKKTVSAVADRLEAEWTEKVGPEAAKILRPLIEETAKEVAKSLLKSEVEPLKAQAESLEKASSERAISAAVAEFGAKIQADGGEWDQATQDRMAALIARIEPGKDVGIDEYLDVLYRADAYEQSKKAAVKERYRRLKQAEQQTEPTSTVRPAKAGPTRITPDMTDNDAFELAVSLAQKELQQ